MNDVFCSFLRSRKSRQAAGNDALHHLRFGPERWRTFTRIEYAKPSGGAGANVEQPASTSKGCFGELDRTRDLLALRCNGFGNSTIFRVYHVYDLERGR